MVAVLSGPQCVKTWDGIKNEPYSMAFNSYNPTVTEMSPCRSGFDYVFKVYSESNWITNVTQVTTVFDAVR